MVALVRAGQSLRSVARQYRVSLSTVQRWTTRARAHRLDRVDWTDGSHRPVQIYRTDVTTEDLVLELRRTLKETSDLGEYGAHAIRRALLERAHPVIPTVRTIGRILERRGALDGQRRLRRPPPPRGWYLPDVAARRAELDSFDVVEGLVIRGGTDVEVLTGISLHGGLTAAWPGPPVTARDVVERLTAHWQRFGLPAYAQFDNDTRFQGAHQHRDCVSRVMRLCLSLNIVPVFTPVQEPGFQASLENWNGRWQGKVWARFHHESLTALADRSDRYVAAVRMRAAERLAGAPPRRFFPGSWRLDLQEHPSGRMIFMRRTTERGHVSLLGHSLEVDRLWSHRLVRCDVHLDREVIRFYALRRRQPEYQPLLRELTYSLPRRRFKE
jgi:hypothetical protein